MTITLGSLLIFNNDVIGFFQTIASENMTIDKDDNDNDEELTIEETVNSEGLNILSLKLLPLVRNLQSKHGLRHGDYQRYRGYCSRRLARLRKVLKLIQVTY